MRRLLCSLWLLLAAPLAWGADAHPDASADTDPQRQQIKAERRRIERDFAAQEAACRQRFAVTDCVEDTRLRRRQALAAWRERELALDAADRARRAAERKAAIQDKLSASAQAPASAPAVEHRPRESSTTPAKALPASAPAANPARAAEAAARAQQMAERRADAQAAQARVARHRAERAQEGKPVQPLPVPAPASGAASARR